MRFNMCQAAHVQGVQVLTIVLPSFLPSFWPWHRLLETSLGSYMKKKAKGGEPRVAEEVA